MIFLFRFRRPHIHLFICIASLYLLFIHPLWVFGENTHSYAATSLEPEPLVTSNGRVLPAADAVCLFTIQNGTCEPQFFSRSELLEGRPLAIRGYVVGVVVFGPPDLQVHLGNQRFRPIESSADGTFLVKGYGMINPDDLSALHPALSGDSPQAADMPALRSGSTGFHHFPKVFGDAVSVQSRFELQLANGVSQSIVEINHQPIQAIDLNSTGGPRNVTSSTFHYVGHRLDALLQRENDFNDRLTAIADGIRLVEEAFQLDLVHNVQLIDLNQRNNAFTHEGRSTIWFYIDTVLNTSLEELRRMASHEALHQLAYRLRLGYHSQLRRFFADLWELDDLSVARFQMVTTGWFDSQNTLLPPSGKLFFAFINEKNFMQGMRGGHSHDNLDEFLASFLHSLLYCEKLAHNLQMPVKLYDSDVLQALKGTEKAQLLGLYKQSIGLLMQTTEAALPNSGDQGKLNFTQFLKERLKTIEQITTYQGKPLHASEAARKTGPSLSHARN